MKNGYATQASLAKVLFVNQTAVSQWERGVTTPSPAILLKLSSMYGVSTDYLLGNKLSDEQKKADILPDVGSVKMDDLDKKLMALLPDADPEVKKAFLALLEHAKK